MPPRTQRRNTAYLNRLNSRFGKLDREIDAKAPPPGPDLRLISEARSTSVSDQTISALTTWKDYALECAA
jgi:hypothetical protein